MLLNIFTRQFPNIINTVNLNLIFRYGRWTPSRILIYLLLMTIVNGGLFQILICDLHKVFTHLEFAQVIFHVVTFPKRALLIPVILILLIQMHIYVLLVVGQFNFAENCTFSFKMPHWRDLEIFVIFLPIILVFRLQIIKNKSFTISLVKLGPNRYPILKMVFTSFAK